jgi:hypothetical protein
MHNSILLHNHVRNVSRSFKRTGDDDTLLAYEVAMSYYIKMYAAERMEQIALEDSIVLLRDIDREPPPIISAIEVNSKPYPEHNRKKGKKKRW